MVQRLHATPPSLPRQHCAAPTWSGLCCQTGSQLLGQRAPCTTHAAMLLCHLKVQRLECGQWLMLSRSVGDRESMLQAPPASPACSLTPERSRTQQLSSLRAPIPASAPPSLRYKNDACLMAHEFCQTSNLRASQTTSRRTSGIIHILSDAAS